VEEAEGAGGNKPENDLFEGLLSQQGGCRGRLFIKGVAPP